APLSRIASLSCWAALGLQRTEVKLVVLGRLDLAGDVGGKAVGNSHEGSDATGVGSGARRLGSARRQRGTSARAVSRADQIFGAPSLIGGEDVRDRQRKTGLGAADDVALKPVRALYGEGADQ